MSLDMDVVADMVLAVAVIAIAAGTIAEFQVGVGTIRAAADGALVKEDFLGGDISCLNGGGGGELDHSCLPGSRSLTKTFADLEPQRERDDVDDIFSKEQEVICDGDQGEKADRERIGEYIRKSQHQIEHCEDPSLHRDDKEEQERGIGIQCRIGQKQAHIQVGNVGPNIVWVGEHKTEDVHQDHAGEIEEVEPERAPLIFDDPAE